MSFHRWMIDSDTASRLHALAPGETLTIMGRCPERRCRRGTRLEVPGITMFAPSDEWGSVYGMKALQPGAIARGYVLPEGYTWIGSGAWLSERARVLHQCPEHLRAFEFAGLRHTLVATSACGQACEEATGAECKCSCNGANHGAAA